jgi:hypothetical protein
MSKLNFSDVFISHATEDEGLAEAWRFLIQGVTGDEIKPWYSEYKRPKGGVKAGEDWRQTITQALEHAKIIIVILTPGSVERPWVHYEVGFARGQNKKVLPVLHFMERENVNNIFRTMTPQVIQGRDKQEVFKLIEDAILPDKEISDVRRSSWEFYFEEFRKKLVQERIASITRTHFQDHFHNLETAKNLQGTWTAQWSQVHDDGREEIFERDGLYIWTTEARIRMVGVNQKIGIKTLVQPEYKYYPMEGVVSSEHCVALSYWSAGTIPICGTCLLKRKGASGRCLSGHWQGYTALNIDDEPVYTRGLVEMVKIDDKFLTPEELEAKLAEPSTSPPLDSNSTSAPALPSQKAAS